MTFPRPAARPVGAVCARLVSGVPYRGVQATLTFANTLAADGTVLTEVERSYLVCRPSTGNRKGL